MARLSSEEAAARLGVKRETVYAYVSRGILSRQRAVDGRSSTFDADEVDRLRRSRLGGHPGRLEAPVTTAVAEVQDGRVAYRGTPIGELVESGFGYEATADLLWMVDAADPWTAPEELVEHVRAAVQTLPPTATLIDRLLSATVMASTLDPFRNDRTRASAVATMRRLVAAVVAALPRLNNRRIPADASIARRLWPRLTKADPSDAASLDTALMLLADHGMATSTLAARMAASTRAGPHAAVIAGLGALNGPLHGAASRTVHVMLEQAEERGADAAIADVLRTNGKVPGIGHFIHRTSDPRFALMMHSIESSITSPDRLAVVDDVIDLTADRISAPHNIDFSLGVLTFATGMQPDAGELIFAIARIAGWVAHALEEYEEAALRFRPVGRYNSDRPRPAPPPI